MNKIGSGISKFIESVGTLPCGLSSGIETLDNVLFGFHQCEMTVIGARPSMGKSAFALGVALTNDALFISTEMGEAQVKRRALCQIAEVNQEKFRRALLSPQEKQKIKEAGKILEESNIILAADIFNLYPFDYKGGIPEQSINKAIEKALDNRCKIIVIDHLNDISYAGWAEGERIRYNRVMEILHKYKKQIKLPILLCSQLHRIEDSRYFDAKKKVTPEPRLSDLKETGKIEEVADNVLLLHRPAYYDKSKEMNMFEDNTEDDAKIIIAKQRDGVTGSITVKFKAACMKWTDLKKKEDNNEI